MGLEVETAVEHVVERKSCDVGDRDVGCERQVGLGAEESQQGDIYPEREGADQGVADEKSPVGPLLTHVAESYCCA